MGLNRLEVARGLHISTWEAVWATVWATLTTGAFQTGFALYLGATPFWLGLLAGLPAAVGLLQIPASLVSERQTTRKRFVAVAALTGRLLWVPILLLPFVLPRGAALPVFIFLLAASSALLTITVPAWTSWMSDLVPADNRGRYFAQRNMLAGVVTMLVPLPAGAFLDQAVKYGRFDPRWGFGVLFGLAALAAIVGATFLLRQPEPPVAPREPSNPLRSLTRPLQDANFRRFLVFAGLLVVGQALAAQFFIAWQVGDEGLNLPYLTVQVLAAFASGAGLGATLLWGYLADKYGSRPVLSLACAGTVAAPFLWVFTLPGPEHFWMNVAFIVVLNVFSGAAWAGVGLAQFNLLLSLAPAETRGTYVAVFSAATGILGGVSPIVGGALMSVLEPVSLPLGPLVLNNFKVLFALSGLVRIVSLLFLTRVRDPEGRSTRYVLGQLRHSRAVSSWGPMRRLSHGGRESERRQAAVELADLRSPLAVEELVVALDDVSPNVREEAARALGEIGDARAVPALVAKLRDPAAAVGDLAAVSLGRIGDVSAVEPLMEAASGPDATVRIAALRALAQIADARALPVLLDALDPEHPTACEAAAEALAALDPNLGPEAAKAAYARLLALLAPDVARGVRLAAARALGALASRAVDPEAYDTLAARLEAEPDAAVAAQAAAALSRLGEALQRSTSERLSLLLPVLDRTATSPLAYRQALAAVARVGLPDDAFYPYLGLRDMARDEAMAKLIEELRRRLRGSAAATLRLDRRAAQTLENYTAGQYGACLRALARLAEPFPPNDAPSEAAAATLQALSRRAEEKTSTGPEASAARPEEALLGALLLREALR